MRISHNMLMLVAGALLLSFCTACAPRYEIAYDLDPAVNPAPEFAKNKMGICTFEDLRPPARPDYAFFQDTWTISDDVLVQNIPETVNTLLVRHFRSASGGNNGVIKIDQNCSAANIKDLVATVHNNGSADYILVGTISRYDSRIYDKNATARLMLGIIPGMVLLFADDVESKTDIEFANLLLIKVDGPQIVWKGRYKADSVKPVRIFADRYEKLVQIHAENTKKAFQTIWDTIIQSADAGFPQRYSVEESRRILTKIKINRSLSAQGN